MEELMGSVVEMRKRRMSSTSRPSSEVSDASSTNSRPSSLHIPENCGELKLLSLIKKKKPLE
eukprot:m.335846 g.335846  ORF g.335846 m.335846 type:complete len:62 (+) comp17690_c0_seq1:212-397(+)